MRIAMHPAVNVHPIGAPVTRRPVAVSSSPAAGQASSANPFAGVLTSMGAGTSGPSGSGAASATSIFGPAASLAAPKAAATPSSAPATAAAAPRTPAGAASTAAAATVQNPGVQALVTAIMDGSFQPTYVTDPSKLQETTPVGTDYMSNFYYASDATANQLASLLGGKVVQQTAFGQNPGWTEPLANFIQLPNGQTFNAADIAYYARCGSQGPQQLTADITAAINEGSAWSKYFQHGGSIPMFPMGYVGPPISGMTYPAGSIGADGNVINPAMQQVNT